jgi:LacI family transcriptional regulator
MSLVEIANLAGVSKSTVSRVINQAPGVAPAIVSVVQRAIQKTGYEPPALRRGRKPPARQGIRTGNVAFLALQWRVTDLYHLPVFASLLHGVERALAGHRLNMILSNLADDGRLPGAITDHQVDGLLLFGKSNAISEVVRSRLKASPVVWLMREHSDPSAQFDHVSYNNAMVSRLAADYLIGRGHRVVAFLNTFPDHSAFHQRQVNFVAAMEEAGYRANVIVANTNEASPFPAVCQSLVERLLNLPLPTTGIFVPTDAQLPGITSALESRGIKPGRDIELIGCDNEEQFLSQLSPRPATIDIGTHAIAEHAVAQLLWRMRHPQESHRQTLLIEPRLVLGDKIKRDA